MEDSKRIMFGNALVYNVINGGNLSINEMRGKDGEPEYTGGTDTCICPKCKKEVVHKRGIPCNQLKCFECKIPLAGKGTIGEIKDKKITKAG